MVKLLPQHDDFRRQWRKIILKTLWEMEKMPVNSIFLFSQDVFLTYKIYIKRFQLKSICRLKMLLTRLKFLHLVNFLPNEKISDWTKLKAVADDNFNMAPMIKFVSDMTENVVGKEENAGYRHFLLFPQCFQKDFSTKTPKGVNPNQTKLQLQTTIYTCPPPPPDKICF